MKMDDKSRSAFIAALRKCADVLEANPEVDVPYFGTQVISCNSREDFRRVVKAFGGKWIKEEDDTSFQMTHEMHENLKIMVYASHSRVCERVVVGTKHIPETVLPAREETVVPARDEEIVKWLCPEILNTEGEAVSK